MSVKLRALVPNVTNNASVWWRITQPFRYLHDYRKKIITLDDDINTLDVKDAIVFLHRIILDDPEVFVRDLKRKGAIKVVYSMDDWTINKEALREYLIKCGAVTQTYVETIVANTTSQIATMRACDDVLVSTAKLAKLVYNDTGIHPRRIDNGIPIDFWYENLVMKPTYQKQEDYVYVGWAGGRRPLEDLEPMAQAWGRINSNPAYNHVRFVVAGYQPENIDENIDLERKIRIPWKSFEEWPSSMQVDVGCCPLSELAFNEGKSPNKFLEYTLSGAAVVASPTVYSSEILDDVEGYIAVTADDWYDALVDLIERKSLRKALYKRALYQVENIHSLEATIEDWKIYLNELTT